MQFKLYLALAAFSFLAIQAQEVRVGVAGAIRNATEQYNTTNARLSEIRSDCKRDGLIYTANCNRTFASVARDITQANIYLQDATNLFRPKVNCAYISNEFNRLQGRIIFVNEQLRQRACSTAPLTKVAVTLNANAIRDAILEQLERINATPQALAKFKSYIDAVKADDTKTAQSFALVEGVLDTLNCALDEL
ncbi:MAG: hypothetical protein L6R35_002850 [Caloplaca aegaea]|nr:MAG: hypothetical protein L6R35_002850 [Caloplaca aegaea]